MFHVSSRARCELFSFDEHFCHAQPTLGTSMTQKVFAFTVCSEHNSTTAKSLCRRRNGRLQRVTDVFTANLHCCGDTRQITSAFNLRFFLSAGSLCNTVDSIRHAKAKKPEIIHKSVSSDNCSKKNIRTSDPCTLFAKLRCCIIVFTKTFCVFH